MTRPNRKESNDVPALAKVRGGKAGRSDAGEPADDAQRLIHERVRLAIVSALAVNASLSFTELKGLLSITDGNLSVHARKLEDGGLLQCTKSFDGRVPKSEYRLTARGRKALEKYLDHMEALIRSVRKARP